MSITPELRAFIIGVVEEKIKELKITKEEFEKLRKAVEENTKAIKELTKAQRRTEKRLEELAIAQKRTEERIEELAEAQKRTEERIEMLSDAQRRTEERINALAEAQKRTEDAIAKLAEEMRILRTEVGRLSETIGFSLEDLARELLPSRLREEGIQVQRLERKYFILDGEEVEINLYGEGILEGERVIVLGEVKSRIYGRDVDRIASIAEKIEKLMDRRGVRVLFGFAVHPSAQIEAEKRGVRIYTAYR